MNKILTEQEYRELLERIQVLENKLDAIGASKKKQEKKDNSEDLAEEGRKLASGILNSVLVGFNEATNILSDLSEKNDLNDMKDVSDGLVDIVSKAIDMQKKVLDRFVEELERDDC